MGADQISDSSRQTTFHLINIAPDACEMAGAPTIKFLDHTDAVVPWPVSLTGPAATPNVVPPSGFAEFTITQTGSDCEPQSGLDHRSADLPTRPA